MKTVLTIAGSDCSGGAGIQADLKTMTAHKIYGMSVITALTAQNTTGVYGVLEVAPEFVAQQIDCVFRDIRPDAVKIGMVSNSEIIEVVVERLIHYQAENIVVDPVMVSTSGHRLLNEEAMNALISKLLPLGTVITPNIPEAEILCGFEIKNEEAMLEAAKVIGKDLSGAVLVKGGHLENNATDLLFVNGQYEWLKAPKINNPNTHGTGCTLSSAIACNLAKGLSLSESISNSKQYITEALKAHLNLGKGRGPVDHTHSIIEKLA
mgnify:CR=1 FL=1